MCVLLIILASFYLFDHTDQYLVNIAAAVTMVTWAYVGFIGVRREKIRLVYVFAVLSIVEPAYIALKLAQMGREPTRYPAQTHLQFLVTVGLAMCVRGLCLVYMRLAARNFGQGLRDKVFMRSSAGSVYREEDRDAHDHDPESNSGRASRNENEDEEENLAAGQRGALVNTVKDYTQPLCVVL